MRLSCSRCGIDLVFDRYELSDSQRSELVAVFREEHRHGDEPPAAGLPATPMTPWNPPGWPTTVVTPTTGDPIPWTGGTHAFVITIPASDAA